MFFLILLFVFACVFVLTPAVIALSPWMGTMDIPRDARRMHREELARNGGLAIVLPLILGALLMGTPSRALGAVLWGGTLMLAVGLADDIFCLGAWSKLALQSLVAVSTVIMGEVGNVWIGAFSVLWIVALTNAHNMIDGMDGLLAGAGAAEAFLLALALILQGRGEGARVALLLMAALLAFRLYNRYPAKLFAGDCGSETVGFLLAALSLPLFFNSSPSFSSLSPFFLFSYPLVEIVSSVLRRVLRGRSPFCADFAHLHHRLYARGLSVPECASILPMLAFFVGVVGVCLSVTWLWSAASLACFLASAVLLRARGYVGRRRA